MTSLPARPSPYPRTEGAAHTAGAVFKKSGTLHCAVPYYKTQKGTKYAVLYNEGFRRVKYALGSYADIIPEYEQMNKPKELFFRYKANVCEMCGAYVPAVKVYQVKSMSDLDVNTEWGAIMNKKKRKTLVVCGDCYDRIHK